MTVLERADVLGGTTAYSGGWVWVPGNHLARAAGIVDHESDVLTYLRGLELGDWDWPRVASYLREAPMIMQTLEDITHCAGISWTFPITTPNFRAGRCADGSLPRGRSARDPRSSNCW